MPTECRVYWLHAISSLHVGAGRGEGFIDLPLAREKVSDFPFIPGSSIKGVFADAKGASLGASKKLREAYLDPSETQANPDYQPIVRAAFGAADPQASSTAGANAGAMVFTDARLICLPIASLFGTFAWCTSRFVLRRLARDLTHAGFNEPLPIPPDRRRDEAAIPQGPPASVVVGDNALFLRELKLPLVSCGVTSVWTERLATWIFPTNKDADWKTLFRERFVVLPDDLFNAMTRHGTEVQAHVRIDSELKRVAEGALWYEESLPAETILAGLVWCDRIYGVKGVTPAQVMSLCSPTPVVTQIGGKASVGKGLVRQVFTAPPPGGTRS